MAQIKYATPTVASTLQHSPNNPEPPQHQKQTAKDCNYNYKRVLWPRTQEAIVSCLLFAWYQAGVSCLMCFFSGLMRVSRMGGSRPFLWALLAQITKFIRRVAQPVSLPLMRHFDWSCCPHFWSSFSWRR